MNERANQWFIEKIENGSEPTERGFRVKWKEILNDVPGDLAKTLKSKEDIYNYIKDWRKDNYDDVMKNYVQKNGDKIKLRIEEIFGGDKLLGNLVERLVSGEPGNIGVSDTGFLYENRGGLEYGNIENDESYKKIYTEGVKLFEYNREGIQDLLPEDTVLVDVGCCEGGKAEALLHGIGKQITYLPVDVDKGFIEKANGKIEKLGNDKISIIVEGYVNGGKITEPIQEINSNETENYTYFFTGGSIGNYSNDDINQLLGTTFKPKQGNLVLDYYKAPKTFGEIRDILKAYDNEATKKRFENGLNNLGFCPWYYFPGVDDLGEQADELGRTYHIPKQGFWYNPVKVDDFLKYTVRYEFEDENNNKYHAELDKSGNLILKSNDGKNIYGINFNDDGTKYNKLRYNGKGWDRIKDDKDFPKFKGLQGKIVEGFEAIKSANGIGYLPDYVGEIYGNPEKIKELEENDVFPGSEVQYQHLMALKDEEIYLQELLCQFGFKGKDGEFIPANFKKGEFYPIEISRRFSDEEMEEILKRNGRNVVKKFDQIGDEEDSKYLNVIVATTSK